MSDDKDSLYARPVAEPAAFRFDAAVARVFPDMIARSVPGYATIIAMTGLLAGRYATADSRCYDLGCSLGASSLAMRQHIRAPACRIIAVDNSPAMLERARAAIAADRHPVPIELLCSTVQQTAIENASVVVLNFTLQFIAPAQRATVLNKIYSGLRPGGILLLSEKVLFADPQLNALNIELHQQFKQARGYSELEIAQKRSALEDVLMPETLATHRQRIADAGFGNCDVWFQCFNFASLIALK